MDFVDLKKQYQKYSQAIDQGIKDNILNASFILGEDVERLEQKLADYAGVKCAVGCASGTDALLIALMAYDIKPGDEIVTTSFTFVATTEMISFLGAKPVFVDIDETNYNLDIDQIESKITNKTRGVIPVSLFGQISDMDRINEIALKYNLFVIEDAAQSFGAIYKDRKSCGLSDVGATSFFPSKPLGCYGDGGMIFTDDAGLAEKIRSIANHGQSQRYRHKYIGLNSRLDSIQAAILLAKFDHFEEEADKRFRIGRRYSELLRGLPIVAPHIEYYTSRSVFAQYSIRVKNRESVINYLRGKGVPTAVHYPIPIHLQEAYQYLGYREGDFPVSEKIAKEILSLPMHPFLTEKEQYYVADNMRLALKNFMSRVN